MKHVLNYNVICNEIYYFSSGQNQEMKKISEVFQSFRNTNSPLINSLSKKSILGAIGRSAFRLTEYTTNTEICTDVNDFKMNCLKNELRLFNTTEHLGICIFETKMSNLSLKKLGYD